MWISSGNWISTSTPTIRRWCLWLEGCVAQVPMYFKTCSLRHVYKRNRERNTNSRVSTRLVSLFARPSPTYASDTTHRRVTHKTRGRLSFGRGKISSKDMHMACGFNQSRRSIGLSHFDATQVTPFTIYLFSSGRTSQRGRRRRLGLQDCGERFPSLSRFGDCHNTSSKGIFGMLPSPDSLMLAMTSYHFDPKKCALYAKT